MPTQQLIRLLNLADTLAGITLLGTTGTTGCQLVGVMQTQLPSIGALDYLGGVAQVDLEQRCSAIQRILTGSTGRNWQRFLVSLSADPMIPKGLVVRRRPSFAGTSPLPVRENALRHLAQGSHSIYFCGRAYIPRPASNRGAR